MLVGIVSRPAAPGTRNTASERLNNPRDSPNDPSSLRIQGRVFTSSLPLKAPANGDLQRHRYDEGERGPIMSKLHPHPSFVDT